MIVELKIDQSIRLEPPAPPTRKFRVVEIRRLIETSESTCTLDLTLDKFYRHYIAEPISTVIAKIEKARQSDIPPYLVERNIVDQSFLDRQEEMNKAQAKVMHDVYAGPNGRDI